MFFFFSIPNLPVSSLTITTESDLADPTKKKKKKKKKGQKELNGQGGVVSLRANHYTRRM